MIYWEDFALGEVLELGSHTFSAEEMIEFARQFDPQPFHIDPDAAKNSFYGGLIASGWHICAICMRHIADTYVNDALSMGSPGLDNIRWIRPVRPGDTLSFRRIVIGKRLSKSRTGVGLMQARWEAINQNGETVMSCEGWAMFGCRPLTASDEPGPPGTAATTSRAG